MKDELKTMLERQGYRIVGSHSGVKLCHWLREKLMRGRPCYKEFFYGIESHRCLQMSPAVMSCNQRCLYCWRYQGYKEIDIAIPDEPEFILEGCIEAQRKLITGYKGAPLREPQRWYEAREPNQVAISLSGEPTLYPLLGDLIDVCRSRGMTTFLVTNGTRPDVLGSLNPLPTQLYISVDAPDVEIYRRLCLPLESKLWDRIMESVSLIGSLNTRTVIRHTLVRGWNMDKPEGFASIDMLGEPDVIEAKAYMFVGYSRRRMNIENMPSHEEIRAFAERLAHLTGYEVAGERPESRVVLLTADGKMPKRVRETG